MCAEACSSTVLQRAEAMHNSLMKSGMKGTASAFVGPVGHAESKIKLGWVMQSHRSKGAGED
jgi:hypothetical protein